MYKKRFLQLFFLCLLLATAGSAIAQYTAVPLRVQLEAQPQQLYVDNEFVFSLRLIAGPADACQNGARTPADIVLVLDVSGSMHRENKMVAAQTAARQFVANTDLTIDQIAVVAFSTRAFVVHPFSQDGDSLQEAIDQLSAGGGTDLTAGLVEALNLLTGIDRRPATSAHVVFLSDGHGRAEDIRQAEQLKQADIHIFTISLGSDADQVLMEQIASNAHDHYYAPQADDLLSVYETVRGQISQAVATDIVVDVLLHPDLNIISGSLSPAGVVNGQQIVWQQPALLPTEETVFQVRLYADISGEYPVAEQVSVAFKACGQEPESRLEEPPGPLLIVEEITPPLTPCDIDPWSNDCIAQTACLGPAILPCTAMAMPWWVCLLLFPLLLIAPIFFWQQRRREKRWQDRPANLGLHIAGNPFTTAATVAEASPDSLPSLLPPSLGRPAKPPAALVVGLGQTGKEALMTLHDTLIERYGQFPDSVSLLSINVESGVEKDEETEMENGISVVEHLNLSINQELLDELAKKWTNKDLPRYLAEWYRPGDDWVRSKQRLALFINHKQVRNCLRDSLRCYQQKPEQSMDVYVIGSLGQMDQASSVLDLAHLIRTEAKHCRMRVALHGLLLLPQTEQGGKEDLSERSALLANAFAAWRELDRWQLVLEPDYPIHYGEQAGAQTERRGRLFERCYLLELETDDGPSLGNVPLADTVYLVMADFITSLLDPATREAWEEVQKSSDQRLSDRQILQQESLYRSAGSFTYVIPIGDLVEAVALNLVDDIVQIQKQRPAFDQSRAMTLDWLQGRKGEHVPYPLLSQLANLARLNNVLESGENHTKVDNKRLTG